MIKLGKILHYVVFIQICKHIHFMLISAVSNVFPCCQFEAGAVALASSLG